MTRPRDKTPLRDLRTYGISRAPRLADYHYVRDAAVHLTICADRGKPFAGAHLAAMVAGAVERCSALCRYALFGYCLMPDHLHVLLSPGDSGVAVPAWLRRFKSHTTNAYVKAGGRSPLWQRSAHDHVCRKEETVATVLTYIVNNPVRAGLVERWMDWPWTKVFVEIWTATRSPGRDRARPLRRGYAGESCSPAGTEPGRYIAMLSDREKQGFERHKAYRVSKRMSMHRRHTRQLLALIVFIVSLLGLVACASAWFVSYAHPAFILQRRGYASHFVFSTRGVLDFSRAVFPVDEIRKPMQSGWSVTAIPESVSGGWTWADSFAFSNDWKLTANGQRYRELSVRVPYMVAALVFIPGIAWPLCRWHRVAQRARQGRCLNCGYDLRASPECCPECGTAVPERGRHTPRDAVE